MVVVAMIVTGNPLWLPSFGSPVGSRSRATRASLALGVQLAIDVHGLLLRGRLVSGLHMPGRCGRLGSIVARARLDELARARSFRRALTSGHHWKPRWSGAMVIRLYRRDSG